MLFGSTMSRSVRMEMKKFIHQIVQTIYSVVTDWRIKFTISLVLKMRMKNWKSPSKIRRSRQYFCERKLKVESKSQQQNVNDFKSY